MTPVQETGIFGNNSGIFVALGVGLTSAVAYAGFSFYKQRQQKFERRKTWNSLKDVVILHQFHRGKFAPSISPFPLKLETYFRMAGIPYENDFEEPVGPKGKLPWITYNGRDMADSQLCLEFLAEKFGTDFSAHLSDEQRAAAWAIQVLAEEHLYWVLVLWRWVYQNAGTVPQVCRFPKFVTRMLPIIARKIKTDAHSQGLGRHSVEEVNRIGMKDLRAISQFLGTKPFLTGDQPTEADCAVFGMLCQFVWNLPETPFLEHFNDDGEFKNLKDFVLRMKERFWPDWDEVVDKRPDDS